MAMPDKGSKNKRTNLFLLRVWCDEADGDDDDDKGPCRVWHGKVQRTVSGEVHSFETKDRLIEALEAMLYKDRNERQERPEHSRPRGKRSSEAVVPAISNNQSKANKGDNHVR